MKNIPISAGFAIITACQLVLGIWMVTLAGIKGGKAKLLYLTNCSHSQGLPVLLRLHPRSPTPTAGTPRRIPPVRIYPAQDPRGRIHEHLPLLWCVGITLSLNRMALILSTTNKPDFFAFSLIIILANKTKVPGLRVPTIMGTIAEDATWYFLVIFTSHFVLVMTLNLGRVSATLPL
jgi:hypothetical protein